MIRLSGFADEAADDIAGQIAATKELGWSFLEARSVDGQNIHDLSEADFDRVAAALEEAGVSVNCFGSTIANWGKDPEEELGPLMETVERCIRRMKRLRVPMVRIMSYALDLDPAGRLLPEQRLEARLSRLERICAAFAAEGLVPVHENCLNYGGIGWRQSLELLERLPSLKFVFDTGNPCLTPDFRAAFPYPNQDAMEAWRRLKPHVVHIHVKDGWRDPGSGEEHYVYPGEGPCQVAEILADCASSGFEGWFSIEPHMAAVFHDASRLSPAERRREVYREYGLRLEALLRGAGFEVEKGCASWPKGKGRVVQ